MEVNCNTCYWEYNGDCVSEKLDLIAQDSSFRTCNCIGWLREDFDDHFFNTYNEISNLIDCRNCGELEQVLEFIKNQRPETCTHKHVSFDLANEVCMDGNVYADTYCKNCGKLIEEKRFLCKRSCD